MKRATIVFPFGKLGLLLVLLAAAVLQSRGAEDSVSGAVQALPGSHAPVPSAILAD